MAGSAGAMVIVGAGHAGTRAAFSLRQEGWGGRIVLLGEEEILPYERPPLSKGYLGGSTVQDDFLLAAGEAYAAAGIEIRPGARCAAIDRARRRVMLAGGSHVEYERLLIATGRSPRRLPGGVVGRVRTHVLRSMADAAALKDHIRPDSRLLVVGGGLIGLEVAVTARALGAVCDVVEAGNALMGRVVPAPISQAIGNHHHAIGVRIRLQTSLVDANPADGAITIRLSDGTQQQYDLLLACIGAEPNVALAEAAGLEIGHGIIVDERLLTSDPDILAAGDVAEIRRASGARTEPVENWKNAEDQGRLAARNLMGFGEPFAAVPWFWSDQGTLSIQGAGEHSGAALSVERRYENGDLVAFSFDASNRLVGVHACGSQRIARDVRAGQMLIEKSFIHPQPRRLSEPADALKAYLK